MTRAAVDAGDKRVGSDATWAKVKFDRQIVAIAQVRRATAIYSDDADGDSNDEKASNSLTDRRPLLVLFQNVQWANHPHGTPA
jgi:hypothetical protein